jgi:hypothetical protein
MFSSVSRHLPWNCRSRRMTASHVDERDESRDLWPEPKHFCTTSFQQHCGVYFNNIAVNALTTVKRSRRRTTAPPSELRCTCFTDYQVPAYRQRGDGSALWRERGVSGAARDVDAALAVERHSVG